VRWFGTLPDRGAFESSVGTTSTTITVTNTNDSGAGSLRQAISDDNVSSNLNRIHFGIGSTCGPRIINLATPLPTITGPVVIDGYTQPGSARNTAHGQQRGALHRSERPRQRVQRNLHRHR
jgi:hypothetical protein